MSSAEIESMSCILTLSRFFHLMLFSPPSISCTDYQSRAMEIRCGQKKLGDREKKYVHMLNATLCATGRAICCLLENYQEKDGTRHC